MSLGQRWLFAVLVILVDLLVIILPITGLVAAYVLVTRPPWFRSWVTELYGDP